MSISEQISRIQTDRNTIRSKLVELGLATSTANLDTLAEAVEGLVNQGAVSIEIYEGSSYTIPAGYHNGSGVVKALTDTTGDTTTRYKLQAKTVTPTKSLATVGPDDGYYGLESVTVNAIPDAYQDVTSVTASAATVLAGAVFVAKDGTVTTGTMTNRGAITATLAAGEEYPIPKGYHNGNGYVSALSLAKQTDGTADAEAIRRGLTAWVNGEQIVGTMPTVTLGNITITVSGTTGQIVATATTDAGYTDGGEQVQTSALTTTPGATITPTKEAQTAVSKNVFTLGEVTVAAIPDAYQDVTNVTASADKVLTGSVFVDSSGEEVSGTMANNGAVSKTLQAGGTYTVPVGYHNGSGTVTAASLASQTEGTAIAANILSGKVAWVNGNEITGSMTNRGAVNITLDAGDSYPVPPGYHNGSGTVTAASLDSQTEGDADAANILSGKTAWVYGKRITGSMTNNGAVEAEINGLSETLYTIPAGYHDGTGSVSLTSDIEEALAAI